MQPLVLSPAVNVSRGRAVQLGQTRPDGTVIPERDLGDPAGLVATYAAAGASRVLVIDLDAARGTGSNLTLISRLHAECPAELTFSGGLRDAAAVAQAFEAGATRVQLGTAALESPDWAARMFSQYGDRVSVALDVVEGELATHGRTVRRSGAIATTVGDLMDAGCRRFVVRCLASDGRLTGPNYELLGEVCALARTGNGAAVVASGGVAGLEDIRRLRGLVPIGLEGVIVGTALYQGLFSLADALDVAQGERPLTTPLLKENA